MTRLSNYINRLLLSLALLSAVSIGSATAESGARLVILRAPNFGWNIALHLQIDGRSVASVVQGRSYDRFIPAGRHVLTVSTVPNMYFVDPTSIGLNVRPGHVYAFMAMWEDPYRVVLRPTLLTPAQLAQLRP
jgi:hypothetical protein